MIITTTGPRLRALHAGVANDSRFYLHAYLLRRETNDTYSLTSTDGHGLITFPVDVIDPPGTFEPMIIAALQRNPPKSAERVTITIQSAVDEPGFGKSRTASLVLWSKSRLVRQAEILPEVDGTYPDIDRMFPDASLLSYAPSGPCGFDPELMARYSRALTGGEPKVCRVQFAPDMGPMMLGIEPDVTVLIMPGRV